MHALHSGPCAVPTCCLLSRRLLANQDSCSKPPPTSIDVEAVQQVSCTLLVRFFSLSSSSSVPFSSAAAKRDRVRQRRGRGRETAPCPRPRLKGRMQIGCVSHFASGLGPASQRLWRPPETGNQRHFASCLRSTRRACLHATAQGAMSMLARVLSHSPRNVSYIRQGWTT